MRTFPDAVALCLSAATSALMGRRYLSCLWELTYRCPARCTICSYWRRSEGPEPELSLSEIEEGLDRVFAEAMLAIVLMDHALRNRAQNADVVRTTPVIPGKA